MVGGRVIVMKKIALILILTFSFSIAANSLDRESEARKIFVESSMEFKKLGCSPISIISNISDNYFKTENDEGISEEQFDFIFKIFECLELYKNKILPINEKLISEYPETEAAFELVRGLNLSRNEVKDLENLITNLIKVDSLSNLLLLKNNFTDNNEEVNALDSSKETSTLSNKNIEPLTDLEIKNLMTQISNCWNLPAGVEFKKEDFMKVNAQYMKNGQIIKSSFKVLESNIKISESRYKTIEKSAMSALFNSKCETLNLPEDKHKEWKKISITFDYSLMQK